MNEKPIILYQHEVKAILGDRQTMLRRVVKLPPTISPHADFHHLDQFSTAVFTDNTCVRCPYGQIGGLLWTKELLRCDERGMSYADGARVPTENIPDDLNVVRETNALSLMPRWASRITLGITNIRVERLQKISDSDAIREGIPDYPDFQGDCPVDDFQDLWDKINGKREGCSWSDNPFVWVIEFKRLEV